MGKWNINVQGKNGSYEIPDTVVYEDLLLKAKTKNDLSLITSSISNFIYQTWGRSSGENIKTDEEVDSELRAMVYAQIDDEFDETTYNKLNDSEKRLRLTSLLMNSVYKRDTSYDAAYKRVNSIESNSKDDSPITVDVPTLISGLGELSSVIGSAPVDDSTWKLLVQNPLMLDKRPIYTDLNVEEHRRKTADGFVVDSAVLKRYYSVIDAEVYFGNEYVEDVADIAWTVQQNNMPLFGYNSYTFDEMARGNRLISGTFLINFTSPNYLFAILKAANNANNATITEMSSYDLPRLAEDIKPVRNSAVYGERIRGHHTHMWPENFDIDIVFGEKTGVGDPVHIVLTNVAINSSQIVLSASASGAPPSVMEQYSFIAQDIKTVVLSSPEKTPAVTDAGTIQEEVVSLKDETSGNQEHRTDVQDSAGSNTRTPRTSSSTDIPTSSDKKPSSSDVKPLYDRELLTLLAQSMDSDTVFSGDLISSLYNHLNGLIEDFKDNGNDGTGCVSPYGSGSDICYYVYLKDDYNRMYVLYVTPLDLYKLEHSINPGDHFSINDFTKKQLVDWYHGRVNIDSDPKYMTSSTVIGGDDDDDNTVTPPDISIDVTSGWTTMASTEMMLNSRVNIYNADRNITDILGGELTMSNVIKDQNNYVKGATFSWPNSITNNTTRRVIQMKLLALIASNTTVRIVSSASNSFTFSW